MKTLHFLFLSTAVVQYCFLCKCNTLYSEDSKCDFNQGQEINQATDNIIHYNTYTPRQQAYLFNCSSECSLQTFTSISELSSPDLFLKSCFKGTNEEDAYECETIRYKNLRNIDKLLFLNKTIPNKSFYLVDCSFDLDGKRKCYKKEEGTFSENLESQERFNWNGSKFKEFICEEDILRIVKRDTQDVQPSRKDYGKKHEFADKIKILQFIKAESLITAAGKGRGQKVYVAFPKVAEAGILNCSDTACNYGARYKVEAAETTEGGEQTGTTDGEQRTEPPEVEETTTEPPDSEPEP